MENQTKINIIYGKSGTGKSEYIYKDIDKKVDKYKNIYIIVPEQSNLTSERKFFEITGRKAMLNVEVLTLSRMAYRISSEINYCKNLLSKTGKSMLIYDLLVKNKKDLNFLGKSEKNIEVVSKMFSEFKKHNVVLEDLNNLELQDKYIQLKLNDIKILYEKYEEKLSDYYIDENDELTKLAENIKYSNIFENSIIYFDEFFGFTPQEYYIFEELIKKCDEVSVAICLDKIETDKPKESDIFYFNRKFAKKILEISENQNCKLNLVNLDKPYRFKNDELLFLEKSLYNGNQKYDKTPENIEIFLASNPYTELENVAQKIYNLVKLKDYKYREIGIVANDIEGYSEDAKVIFAKYDIPIFVDEKKALNQNILIKYIISMLDIFVNNWSYDSIFNYLKIGLLDIEYYDICRLENYCKKWGIRGTKFYNREFNYELMNDNQQELENLRKKIVNPLIALKRSFMENKTVIELTQEIYKFLIENKIIENLDFIINKSSNIEISNEYNTSYKILISIFEEMVDLFGNEKVTFEKYKELLTVGINSSELGKIPATQDQVILGDIDRTRSNKIKVLFVVGMNDGIFPKVNKQEGYLNDQDRIILQENGIELAKTSREAIYESQFNIYRTFSIPEEKLFLSYCSSDKEGKSVRPAIIIKKIKRVFPKLKEKSDIISKEYVITNEKATFENSLELYKKYLDGEEIDEKWKEILVYFYNKNKKSFIGAISGANYTNQADNISLENIKKLYGNVLKGTVSKLESYRRCPFSFHMNYGLKIKEPDNFQIRTIDTGSFMHEVIDAFFEYIDDNNMEIKKITDEQMTEIVNKLIEDILQTSQYYIFTSTAKYRMMTRRLKKVVLQSMKYIIYSLKCSDFKQIGHEVSFGEKSEYKPIKLELDSGEKIEIIGKIDRIDLGRIDDKKYVRIIDYKSQVKKLDLNQVVSGLQIQLITYLDAITEQDKFEPAGVLYLGLIDNITKEKRNIPDEEIEKKIRRQFKMQGLILADVKVVRMMDNKLEKGYSDVVPAFIDKNGELSSKSSSIASKDEFEALQKTVKKTIKQISKEILSGDISIKPYNYNQKNGCTYCPYKSICMFNPNINGNEYNYIKRRTNDEIMFDIVEQQ